MHVSPSFGVLKSLTPVVARKDAAHYDEVIQLAHELAVRTKEPVGIIKGAVNWIAVSGHELKAIQADTLWEQGSAVDGTTVLAVVPATKTIKKGIRELIVCQLKQDERGDNPPYRRLRTELQQALGVKFKEERFDFHA